MKNMQRYGLYLFGQVFFYGGYLACLNRAHALFPNGPTHALQRLLQGGGILFNVYAVLSFVLIWIVVRRGCPSLRQMFFIVNLYHLVLFTVSFALELLFQYAYFKWESFAIQTAVLWGSVNLVALIGFWIARLHQTKR